LIYIVDYLQNKVLVQKEKTDLGISM
jgi:hypothetical protein